VWREGQKETSVKERKKDTLFSTSPSIVFITYVIEYILHVSTHAVLITHIIEYILHVMIHVVLIPHALKHLQHTGKKERKIERRFAHR